ncbi:MAG: hypothetical protein L6243_02755 [Candidatus Altiarchaeales archaeon]|nr:hypothetical protein [Candidatus Altiarchaeota archaeon]MBU4341251.1 hypothetical protein [Candidatus Altiarchaeota archaeon]MCG2782486.1 hypothetical protein [Candidatus Altiarchaeales archaeon]
MTAEERHIIEQKRLEAQRKRILKQRETENERAVVGHNRGEEVTGIDELERRKVSAESRWIGKWDRRRAKWNHRAEKYEV